MEISDLAEYTKEDMVNDFVNPAEYKKASELANEGNLTVKSVNLSESEEYGESYAVTFETEDGRIYLSYISAKQPFAVFEHYGDTLVGCVVAFNRLTTKDKKTIVKMALVQATKDFKP